MQPSDTPEPHAVARPEAATPANALRACLAQALDVGRRCLERCVEIEFVDRSIALASLTFTSLIPLGVVLGSVTPVESGGFANSVIRRFKLEGSTADIVQSVFAPPSDVRSTVSVVGVVLLIASALSFARGLQRVYERSWRLQALGVRATPSGLTWLLGIAVVVSIIIPVRHAIADSAGPLLGLVVAFTVEFFVWLLTPYLLLSRRVPWRSLVPTSILTAVAMDGLSVASVIYMPRAIEESAERYGTIGIAISLMSWFVAAGFVLVTCAVVGAVLGERRGEWRAGPPLATDR